MVIVDHLPMKADVNTVKIKIVAARYTPPERGPSSTVPTIGRNERYAATIASLPSAAVDMMVRCTRRTRQIACARCLCDAPVRRSNGKKRKAKGTKMPAIECNGATADVSSNDEKAMSVPRAPTSRQITVISRTRKSVMASAYPFDGQYVLINAIIDRLKRTFAESWLTSAGWD